MEISETKGRARYPFSDWRRGGGKGQSFFGPAKSSRAVLAEGSGAGWRTEVGWEWIKSWVKLK